jgi:gliding motility-associated-like protein
MKDACTTPVDCDQVSVQVKTAPFVNFQADSLSGCEPHAVNFTSWGDNVISNYLWNFGDGQNNTMSYLSNPQHTFSDDGLYSVSLTVTDSFGCKNTVTFNNMIQVFPKPNASFIPNPYSISILNPNIHFNNISELNVNNYWIFGDGDSSDAVSPFHKFPAVGKYNSELIVVSEHGCRDTATYPITVVDEYTLYAPNAITPDNDGQNEVFYITGSNISADNFQLFVYDRWGEIIFETNKFNPENPSQYSWNGRVKNNSIAPVGVYTWLVKYKDTNGISHEKTGSLTLIR